MFVTKKKRFFFGLNTSYKYKFSEISLSPFDLWDLIVSRHSNRQLWEHFGHAIEFTYVVITSARSGDAQGSGPRHVYDLDALTSANRRPPAPWRVNGFQPSTAIYPFMHFSSSFYRRRRITSAEGLSVTEIISLRSKCINVLLQLPMLYDHLCLKWSNAYFPSTLEF